MLHATTCVPFVSERCTYIHGAPDKGHGLFFDGALSDYHINLAALPGHPVLLLNDSPRVKQTVFDVLVPWRRAPRALLVRCSVLYPTAAFAAALPDKALPGTE